MTIPNILASPRQAAAPSPLFLDIARDLGIEVSVPLADLRGWRSLANSPSVQQDEDGSLQEVAARRQGYAKQARFATERVNEITRLLLHRHSGPCDTDDGWIWFEAVAPFIIEKAEITKKSIYIEALHWAFRHLPRLVEDVGLFELAMLINVYAEKRSQAARDQVGRGRSYVKWLPFNDDLLDTLRPTWDEITTLQIKGWQVIDRPDDATLMKRATDLRRQKRHAQGVRPQETLIRTQCDDAIATAIGKTRRTIQMWRKGGTLDAKLLCFIQAGVLDFAKMSDPLKDTCRADTFAKLFPANDDQPEMVETIIETIPVEITPANDDTPAPLTETGYIGRNMQMDASELRYTLNIHPALNDDLKRHLDAIDAAMSKTPEETKLRVRRNLLRDRALLAHRERRAREKAEAVVMPMSEFTGQYITLTADEVTELAVRYPALVDGLHDHLAELEGPLKRIPITNRKSALRRMMGARSKLVRSKQRFDRVAA